MYLCIYRFGSASIVSHIGGGSGGYLEHIARYAAQEILGITVDSLKYKTLRYKLYIFNQLSIKGIHCQVSKVTNLSLYLWVTIWDRGKKPFLSFFFTIDSNRSKLYLLSKQIGIVYLYLYCELSAFDLSKKVQFSGR
jgi:hypothetical protein